MSFFSPDPHHDPRLGTFVRRRGRWVGALELAPHGQVELRLAGGRPGPTLEALDAAASLPSRYRTLHEQVATALFEHYEPGFEAWQSGEMEELTSSFPTIAAPMEVWPHVTVTYVDVDPGRRDFPVEVRLRTAWDEEHTLGVRLADDRLVELCGSVGP